MNPGYTRTTFFATGASVSGKLLAANAYRMSLFEYNTIRILVEHWSLVEEGLAVKVRIIASHFGISAGFAMISTPFGQGKMPWETVGGSETFWLKALYKRLSWD